MGLEQSTNLSYELNCWTSWAHLKKCLTIFY